MPLASATAAVGEWQLPLASAAVGEWQRKPKADVCGGNDAAAFSDASAIRIASGVSIFCCTTVLLLFWRDRRLRVHPNTYLMGRVFYDTCFGVFFAYHQTNFKNPESFTEYPVHGCSKGLAALTQASFAGSILTCGLMPLDSMVSMNFPFTIMEAWARRAHVVVLLLAASSGAFLARLDDARHDHTYGLGYGMCWICRPETKAVHVETTNDDFRVFLMYVPVMLVLLSNIGVGAFTYRRLFMSRKEQQQQQRGSRKLRVAIFRSSLKYTVLFTAYWILVVIPFVYIFHAQQNRDQREYIKSDTFHKVAELFLVLLASQGVMDALMFLVVNWDVVKGSLRCFRLGGVDEKRRAYGRASEAGRRTDAGPANQKYMKVLRAEVFTYVAQGIAWSIRRTRKVVRAEMRNSDAAGGATARFGNSSFGSRGGGSFNKTSFSTALNLDGAPQMSTESVDEDDVSEMMAASLTKSAKNLSADLKEPLLSAPTDEATASSIADSANDSDDSEDETRRLRFETTSSRLQSGGRGRSYLEDSHDHLPTSSQPRDYSVMQVTSTVKMEHQSDIKFSDHTPFIFWELREIFGVDHESYLKSVSEPTMEKFSEGASGAFMYFSRDGKYLVKTTTLSEIESLVRILEDYLQYMQDCKRRGTDSMIVRILGAYSIKLYSQSIHFICMANVFRGPYTQHLEVYDLKGSTYMRWGKRVAQLKGQTARCRRCNESFVVGSRQGGSCPKSLNNRPHMPRVVLKDNDLNIRLNLSTSEKTQVFNQLQHDSNFLATQGLMDYSLLLGIKNLVQSASGVRRSAADSSFIELETSGKAHKLLGDQHPVDMVVPSIFTEARGAGAAPDTPFYQRYEGGMQAVEVEGPGIYYLGIVDILQRWTWSKFFERWAKIMLRCLWSDRDALSACPPDTYRRRFQERVVSALVKQRGGGELREDWLFDEDSLNAARSQPYKYAPPPNEGGSRQGIPQVNVARV